VGDEKQAIYGFRFAQRENMDLVFGDHTHTHITLELNYRSLFPILSVANRLTETFSGAEGKQKLIPSQSSRNLEAPRVTWLTLGKELEGEPGKKPPQESIGVLKDREARYIALEIQRLVKEEGYTYGDIAVLMKNHQKTQWLQQALQSQGIPSVRKKNPGFFQEPVIKDAMALLSLLENLEDEVSLFRLLQTRLNPAQLRILANWRAGHRLSLFQSLLQGPALGYPSTLSRDVVEALQSLVEELRVGHQLLQNMSLPQLFVKLVYRLGLLNTQQPQASFSLRMFEKFLHWVTLTSPPHTEFSALLEIIRQYQQEPDIELPVNVPMETENAVQLMTVHASKGLEYPVVFVAYCDDGRSANKLDDSILLFDPQFNGKAGFGLILGKYQGKNTVKKDLYRKTWYAPRSEEEEKRLFYVALTRAKERLYVLRAKQSVSWTAAEYYQNEWMEAWSEAETPDYFERYATEPISKHQELTDLKGERLSDARFYGRIREMYPPLASPGEALTETIASVLT
jgi:ATP-dependent exoDNAse (exonuclease V) beta subunit